MIHDARSGYVYWELSGPVTERFKLAYGEDVLQASKWFLRIFSLRCREAHDIPVDVSSYHCYVDLEPGRLYQAHLGFRDERGSFVSILMSVPKATPVETVSPVLDENWPVQSTEMAKRSAKARNLLIGHSSAAWQARFQGIAEQSVATQEG